MENLKGVCDFDTKAGIATVYIHYDSAEELIDPAVGTHDSPVINEEALNYIQEIVDIVPEDFKVRISLTIDDYQDYDKHVLLDAYHSCMESYVFTEKSPNKKKRILMLLFTILGLSFLALSIAARKNNWFAFGGRSFNIIAVILVEILFDVYFEESLVFFTISRTYQKITGNNSSRLKELVLQ